MYSLRVYLIILILIAATSLISIEVFRRSDLFAAILKTNDRAKLPVCKLGEGYVCPWKTDMPLFDYVSNPKCSTPTWKWNTKSKKWKYIGHFKKCKDRTGKLCSSFTHEELTWRTAAAKKRDPSKFGYYLPDASEKAAATKYDPQRDALVACNPDTIGPYFGIPRSNFEAPCERSDEEDGPIWLEKYRAMYKMHQLKWKQCNEN